MFVWNDLTLFGTNRTNKKNKKKKDNFPLLDLLGFDAGNKASAECKNQLFYLDPAKRRKPPMIARMAKAEKTKLMAIL